MYSFLIFKKDGLKVLKFQAQNYDFNAFGIRKKTLKKKVGLLYVKIYQKLEAFELNLNNHIFGMVII